MSNDKHTPGPWKASGTLVYRAGYVNHNTHRIADADPFTDTIPLKQCEANAQLIARAPELLAENERLRVALQAFVDSDELAYDLGDHPLIRQAREALGENNQ